MGSAGEYGVGRTRVSARKFCPNRFEALGRLDAQHSTRRVDPEVPPAEAVAQRIVRRGDGAAANDDRLEPDGAERQGQSVGPARLDHLEASRTLRQGDEIRLVKQIVLEDEGFAGRERILR